MDSVDFHNHILTGNNMKTFLNKHPTMKKLQDKIYNDTVTRGPAYTNEKDLHFWVEDESGKIIDLDKKQLMKQSMFGTEDLVYQPFSKEIQNDVIKYWRKKYTAFCKEIPYSKQLKFLYGKDTIKQNCQLRALYRERRAKQKGIKLKVVAGSLGFRQPNGDIFWEFG